MAKTENQEQIALPGSQQAKMLHDLQQPLNSIKMISGGILYLLKQEKRVSDAELAECMREISSQTDRAAKLIKSIKL
ncbi:MAG: hypothetical protein LLG02_12610 [Pelosinus sp.]|nr:hypothetical protein [Pelosinus sp.]